MHFDITTPKSLKELKIKENRKNASLTLFS